MCDVLWLISLTLDLLAVRVLVRFVGYYRLLLCLSSGLGICCVIFCWVLC